MYNKTRGFEEVCRNQKKNDVEVKIPLKSTINSAGYDFITPVDIDIPPQSKVSFYTDIKAYMQPGETLLLFPRSSTGIKHDLELANTIAVGDCDFYENVENDGNYKVVLWNRRPNFRYEGSNKVFVHDCDNGGLTCISVPVLVDLTQENTVHVKAGDRLIQGIFFKTLPADAGDSVRERVGGIGSTGE